MQKIIKHGFCPIINDRERGQNNTKGKKLFESGHVFNVTETHDEMQSWIACKVVAQTSVSNHYDVKLTLDCNRNITSATCSCKAGLSGKCKHICALVHFINSPESAESKTSHVREWGKPSYRRQLGYDKGMKMCNLFPQKSQSTKIIALKPSQISTKTLGESLAASPLYKMLKLEEKNEVEIMAVETLVDITRITERRIMEEKAEKIALDIFLLQNCNVQFSSEIVINQELFNFYSEKVCCDVKAGLEIAVKTIDQSENSEWFKERSFRITASHGHRVKGTRFDSEKVIASLLSKQKVETAAMSYGKKREKDALKEYKQRVNPEYELVKVGLIVCLKQPWLGCSPDGVLVCGPNIWEKRLVEIKCPYNCRNVPVFHISSSKLNVKYLKIDENGGIQIRENHSVYTQVQLQMYVTNIKVCDLYVYSPKGSVLISVKRDNMFLSKTLLAMEQFYFKYYLPKLHMLNA